MGFLKAIRNTWAEEKVKRWRRAAEAGNADGQFNLGMFYTKGYGVPQDYAEAVRWFRKAAEQGDAGAQFCLGACYALGRGVPQNNIEAYKWDNLASAQGNKPATTARDTLVASMTPDQIAEAQRLCREFKPS
jgi:TPR repeat protein